MMNILMKKCLKIEKIKSNTILIIDKRGVRFLGWNEVYTKMQKDINDI
jgi:hypothetical protein